MWINFLEMRFAVDNSMIFFDRVTKIYGNGQKALDNVSLKVGRGEFVFLEGDSGAGKTTMLELILKETDPTQGNIQVNGIELAGLRERQIYQYRRYIGMVFQDFRLFSDFTVYENVAFAQRVVEADYKTMKRRVMEVLNQVGLGSKAKYYPDQLSGGEKQRTAIARAIVNRPCFFWPMSLRAIWTRRTQRISCACWSGLTARGQRCWWFPITRSW